MRSQPPTPRSLLQSKEAMRLAVMLALCAIFGALVVGLFDRWLAAPPEKPPPIVLEPPEVPIAPVKREICEIARDDEPSQRLVLEDKVYEHLISCAPMIAPGTLEAMGLSESPSTVAGLRADPKRWRGRPVALQGEIAALQAKPDDIPGMPLYKLTQGRLVTESGDSAFFAVIKPVPQDLKLGSFARIEGFFFKLHDTRFPDNIERAPFVVGLELVPAFRAGETVKELDPKVLDQVDDAGEQPGDIQPGPYHHLASYVMNAPCDEAFRQACPPLTRADAKAMVNATGEVPRGKAFRVLGELYDAQIKVAEPNPLGIKFWTRAWIKHPDLETVQVNIPGVIPGNWHTGDFVVFYGHFLKRHWYQAGLDEHGRQVERVVPLFLAGDLLRWELTRNPVDLWVKIALSAVAVLLLGLLCVLVIRDNRADEEVRQRILERRRQRRTHTT
jgi:hypothetical protein